MSWRISRGMTACGSRFGHIVRVGAFFQPLLYPLLRGLEDANDEVADDFVVMWSGADTGARTQYAAQLTSIAEHYVATTQLAGVGLMTFHSALGRRVQRVLDNTRPIALRLTRPAVAGIALVTLVLTVVTALACSTPRAAAAGNPLAKDTEKPETAQYSRDAQSPPFVDDPAVIGHWTSVDFVDAVDEFRPGDRKWKGDLFLKEISFLPDGKTSGLLLWSKGVTYDPKNKSRAKYQISEIDGVRYLFFEWVTDDVLVRGKKVPFYVLRYAGSPTVELPREPKSPYATQTGQPFVDDPAVVGQWTSVDLVDAMDQFTPGKPRWKRDLFLKSIAFMPDGRTSGPWLWSKGVAYDPNSKSQAKYQIREIDGTRYLFFEWITDDVLVRGGRAPFYVLKYSGTPVVPPVDPRVAKSPYIAQAPPPFVDDPTVVGKWKTVDLVETLEQFTPGKQRAASDELDVKFLEFMPHGRTSGPMLWSKGLAYHSGDKSKAAYVIRELSGARYLFLERITGDVVLRGEKPLYYVMQYVGPSNAPAVAPTEPQGTKLDTAPVHLKDSSGFR